VFWQTQSEDRLWEAKRPVKVRVSLAARFCTWRWSCRNGP